MKIYNYSPNYNNYSCNLQVKNQVNNFNKNVTDTISFGAKDPNALINALGGSKKVIQTIHKSLYTPKNFIEHGMYNLSIRNSFYDNVNSVGCQQLNKMFKDEPEWLTQFYADHIKNIFTLNYEFIRHNESGLDISKPVKAIAQSMDDNYDLFGKFIQKCANDKYWARYITEDNDMFYIEHLTSKDLMRVFIDLSDDNPKIASRFYNTDFKGMKMATFVNNHIDYKEHPFFGRKILRYVKTKSPSN